MKRLAANTPPAMGATPISPTPSRAGHDPETAELLQGFVRLAARLLARPEPVASAHGEEPWLTTAEGARYAAVSEDTLREWINAGLLTAGRCGRVLRVRRSAIDRVLLAGDTAHADASSTSSEAPSPRALEIAASLGRKAG